MSAEKASPRGDGRSGAARPGMRWLVAAGVLGLVHGAFSLAWAFGAQVLIDTVPGWAVQWRTQAPLQAGLILAAIALAKFAFAAAPVANEYGKLPGSRQGWRWIFVVGAALLTLYGAVNTVGAWIGLIVGSDAPRAAVLGHAVLWDPLFVAWGACALIGLRAATLDARAGSAGDAQPP